MGKLSEERGILNAQRMTRPMENLFLRVITLDEHYDNAGGHKALGRMYFRLPGFPISFGDKKKAIFHLKRALELYPHDIIARAFYAEALYDMGKTRGASTGRGYSSNAGRNRTPFQIQQIYRNRAQYSQ